MIRITMKISSKGSGVDSLRAIPLRRKPLCHPVPPTYLQMQTILLAALCCPPRVAAIDTLRLVHAKARATFRTGPLACFLGDKILYADGTDALLICDEADSVLRPVTFVHMKQVSAGILGAGEAELMSAGGKFLAVINGTSKASVRLVEVAFAATRTGLVFPNVSTAQAAIKAARRDDHRVLRLYLRDFVGHTVPPVPGSCGANCRLSSSF
jgi:type IV secretory pathway TrbD component